MRICIDLDGTICETKTNKQTYLDVKPKKNAVKVISKLKKEGHEIIIYTARHMKSCDNNVGKVIAKQGYNLFKWLDKHKIPYDEIWFGKPLADVYIDDKAEKFNTWDQISKKYSKIKKGIK